MGGKNVKKDSLLSKEIDLSYFVDNLESILAKVLAVVVVSFPAIELICAMLGCHFAVMRTQLRTIGYVGFTFMFIIFLNVKKHRFVMSDLLLLCMVICSVLSIVFSFDIDSAIAGNSVNHAEDIGQVIGYYIIFFAATHIHELKNLKLILRSMLVATLLHTVPAYLQHFGLWPWTPKDFIKYGTSAFGLTQHFNFYGALAVIFSGLVTMIYLIKNNKRYMFWYIAAIICFLAGLFSNCRLTWVGFAGYIFFILMVEFYRKKKKQESIISMKRYGIVVLSFVVIFVLVSKLDGTFASQISETAGEIDGDYVGSLGTGRMEIWMVGLYGVKDHLLTGLGLDNYIYAYDLYPYKTLWYPALKAHNEYIHTLVTQGLPALIAYLAMCFYVVLFSIKNIFDEKKNVAEKAIIYIFVVMAVGYFCQAMFNSSVTNVAPYKWLIMGLLLPRVEQKEIKWIRKKRIEDAE